MTTSRRAYRGRRVEAHDGRTPEAIARWFAGTLPAAESPPWEALLEPARRRVPEWWAAWLREHPGAIPPADALPGQFPGA